MTRVLLLRHGATASHRGDMPLTPVGRQQAEGAGRALGGSSQGRCVVLTSTSTRAQQTGALLALGMRSAQPDVTVNGPWTSWGLRNPDLYLAGQRVEMVSTTAAFSAQVPGLSEADVGQVAFFADFVSAGDRIGHWLRHPAPPGEGPTHVARRVVAFAASLLDGAQRPDVALCVTHSPVLRAVAVHLLGEDPGEPEHLTGIALDLGAAGDVTDAAPVRPGA